MHAQVDVHGHGALVLTPARCHRGIDHPCHGNPEFSGNPEQQAQLGGIEVGWDGQQHSVALRALRDLLELAAHDVGRAEMVETAIGKRLGLEIEPESIVDAPRLQARLRKRRAARCQPIVFEQRDAGLAIQDSTAVQDEAFLHQLQLVHEEHQEDADQQRDKSRVECNTEALGNAGDIALHGLVGLGQRLADTAHGTDEADRRYRPGNVANH